MKQSFYKTTEEKMLRCAIDKFYNDYVGGNECHYYDTNEIYWNFDEETLIEWITRDILKEEKYILCDNGIVLEAKHIRFIGKLRVREIVKHRVKFRHTKEGWVWEN